MPTYHEHPSKVAAWRDGGFVLHPDADLENCAVWFALEEDDHWEGVLATRGDDSTAVLRGVPLLSYGFALGDTVGITEVDDALVVRRLIEESGLLTYRVLLAEEAADDRWQGLMRELETWNCWFDVRDPWFMGVAVPPESAPHVVHYLQAREDAGELQWEAGH